MKLISWRSMGSEAQRTFNVSRSCSAILHSSSLNSYCHKLAVLFPVMSSMAALYCNANANMLNVEFHHVATSRGILRASSFSFSSVRNHSGNTIVIEWIIPKAIFRSCSNHSIQIYCRHKRTYLYKYKSQRPHARIKDGAILS